MEKLVLIDGNSLINRAFYAMPSLITKDGVPTNAVYGFLNMLFKTVSDIKPKYLAVAFDMKAPTFRHKLYAEYKGTRKPMPDDLRPQIPLLKEVLSLMGVYTIEKEGVEADDIIGTVAKNTDIKTIIITGDKDSFQLVDEQTEVHFTKRGITDTDVLNAENFSEKTSLSPAQIIELKALMGDASDNIPGVKGIGEKTALTLLKEYGNIDNLYANARTIGGKLGEKLLCGRESAFLSRTLATIDVNCGVNTDVSLMIYPTSLSEAVRRKFSELEFKTFVKKNELFANEPTEPKQNDQTANTLSEEKENAPRQALSTIIIDEVSALTKILEPQDLTIISAKSVNVYNGDGKEYLIPIKENLFDEGMNYSDVLSVLGKVFADKNKRLTVFGVKPLMHALKNYGLELHAAADDVSIMKYLADFTGKDENLSDVLYEYGLDTSTPAYSLFLLSGILKEKLLEENMYSLYADVELPLAKVLFDMETAGFKIDLAVLNATSEKYQSTLAALERDVHAVAGENFNINSPKQLGVILFEKMQIGRGKKTKTGYSTAADVLENFADDSPIIPLILRYRQIQKLQSTYVEGFRPLIDRATGLIHTSFNQLVTSTGRLSSKEPNLQNIPVRDEEGKEIRRFFVPRDDKHILVGADYSQIELRLLAHFSDCPKLIEAFNNEQDIHTLTASQVFGVPTENVTSAMRRSAKAVNFGIIYGISEFGLAKNIKVSNAQARDYINAYFEKYPEVKLYMNSNVEKAKQDGYVTTLLGRRRYIRELSSANYNVRQFGERAAMNMPLQGSSADIIKLAMLGVSNRLNKETLGSRLILQVHDELIVDALISEQAQVQNILKEEMENAVKLKVKLTVDTEIGATWFDAK